jgi:signal peptidase II
MRWGFWLVAPAVVLLDQWTKHLVQAQMSLHESIPVIPGALSFTYAHNTGVAFGQLQGAGPVLIVLALAAVAAILWYQVRLRRTGQPVHPLLAIGLALPLGGAIGNLIDRIRYGYVVDFIDLGWWPIFNVADSAITIGAACVVLYFTFVQRADEGRALSVER